MNKHLVAKRILQVFTAVFVVLSLTYIVKGQTWGKALECAAIWSSISTLIFSGSMIYSQKTKKSCAACVPVPDAKGS